MKKLVFVLSLILALVTVSLADEILFRGIPWGTNVYDVHEKLVSDGVLDNGALMSDCDMMVAWSVTENHAKCLEGAGASVWSDTIPSDFRVAGYPINFVSVNCPFSYTDTRVDRSLENTRFFRATMRFDVADVHLVYADLANKLTSLYGTPVEEKGSTTFFPLSDEPSYIKYYEFMVWYGDNNTGVKLYKEYYSDNRFTKLELTYGKTDGEEYLQNMQGTINYEKSVQDQLNQQNNVNNVDGL